MMLNDACDKLRGALRGRACAWAAVLAVAVSLVLGGAGGLGLARAFADGTSSGYTITINEATSGSYSAYLLFTGSYDEDGNFGDVAFNDAVRDAVLTALGSVTGNTYTVSTSTSADDDGTSTTTTTYSIKGSSDTAATTYTATNFVNAVIDDIAALSKADAQTFANTLAVALTATTTSDDGTTTNAYTPAATTTFTASETNTSATLSVSAIGYYLVVQTSATESDDAVTSAILMPVTGSASVDQATAKVSTPTLDKEVADTASSTWDSDYTTTDVADQGVTSTTTESTDTDGTTTSTTTYDLVTSISYRLTGTVASNIAEYSTYYYAFVDLLPEGVNLVDSDGKASAARVTNTSSNTVWTVTFYLATTTTDEDGNEVESLEKITLSSDLTSDPFTVSVAAVTTGEGDDAVTQYQVTWACTDLIAALKNATYGDESTTLTTSDYANVQIVLEYSIDLTSDEIDALYASAWSLEDPMVNSAKVVFSNSPYATSTAETPEDTTQVYSYNLVINKIGEATNATSTYWATTTTTNSDGTTSTTTTLVYAKTTTTTTTDEETGEETSTTTTEYYTDSSYTTKYTGTGATYTPIVTGAAFTLTYVDSDGNTVVAGKDITEGDDGTFTFTGLEAGITYTITETTTPDGYKSIDPITFTITATKDDTGEYVTSISVTENSDPSNAATLSVSGATVTATITNVKGPDIPFTGSTGIVLGLVIGGAIIAISLVAMVRNRKREQS